MKKIHLYIIFCFLSISFVNAQEVDNKFSFGINIKGFYPGIEIAAEHPLGKNFLQTNIGVNSIRFEYMNYSNSELTFKIRHFKQEEPKGLNYGPYFKIKRSYYSKFSDTASYSIHETTLLYAGAGIHTGYRLLLGKRKHFLVEPFVGIGVNIILVSDDINYLQVDLSKLYHDIEPDFQAGIGLAWSF